MFVEGKRETNNRGGLFRKNRSAPGRRSSIDLFFRRFATVDDIALGEEDLLQFRAPVRTAAEQKFQIHSEMLEFLFLSVLHDRVGLRVLLDRHPLLIPTDRLSFLDQGGDHASKGPRL